MLKWFSALVSISVLGALSQLANLSPTPIELVENQGEYPVGLQLEILEDPHGEWSIEQVSSPEFEAKFFPSKWEVPNFGLTRSVYWVRFEVVNRRDLPETFLLEIRPPSMDYIDFYLQTSSGEFTLQQTGDRYPFAQRPLEYRDFVFPIPLEVNQSQVIYIRFQMEGTMQLPLKIWDYETFIEANAQSTLFQGLYFGLMIAMVIYNLFLYLSIRDKSYLYYFLYILGFVSINMIAAGIMFQYLWRNAAWWNNHLIPILNGLSLIFAVIFVQLFLNTKENTPFLDKVLKGFTILGAVIVILGFTASYRVSISLSTLATTLSSFLFFIIGIACWRKNYRPSRFFVLAFSILLIGVILYTIRGFGLLPVTFFTENSIQIGSAIEVMLLSLALADKINILKQERETYLKLQLSESQKLASLGETFRKFVPQEFLSLLHKENIVDVNLGDSVQRSMTILFADIRSFTAMSEDLSPEDTFKFVNKYLSLTGPLIRQHHGFIDKYIGDAIMALFQNADDALHASLNMLQTINQYNASRQLAHELPIQIGIGINTGELMLGTVGEHNRIQGTVISDAVNLASRIDGVTKVYGVSFLITEHTYNAIQHPEQFFIRRIDRVKVKGKHEPITIFEVTEFENPNVSLFHEALNLYYAKQFPQALAQFQKYLSAHPNDGATKLYIERCQSIINEQGVPENWDGVTSLVSK